MFYFPAVFGALLITVLFVGVLYIRPDLPRNDPWKVKLRMMGVFVVCCCTWIPLALLQRFAPNHSHKDTPLHTLLGLEGSVVTSAQSSLISLLFTSVLFAGPLTYMLTGDEALPYNLTRLRGLRLPNPDLLTARDILIAPLAEEFVFRACMVPLFLLEGYSPRTAIFTVPLFFGAAHLHHLYEAVVRQGQHWRPALAQVLFQFTYTTLFGWYAVYLFIRTGSVLAPALAHVFCNIMGVPDFAGMIHHPTRSRLYVCLTLCGIAMFGLCLPKVPRLSSLTWP